MLGTPPALVHLQRERKAWEEQQRELEGRAEHLQGEVQQLQSKVQQLEENNNPNPAKRRKAAVSQMRRG